jgi:hypothetical protein
VNSTRTVTPPPPNAEFLTPHGVVAIRDANTEKGERGALTGELLTLT